MVSDELVGIAGVFGFTFCLIALYHFIGMFGRHRKTYGAQIRHIREPHQHRSPDLNKSLARDDAWLLWSPDLSAPGGPPKPGFGAQRNKEPQDAR